MPTKMQGPETASPAWVRRREGGAREGALYRKYAKKLAAVLPQINPLQARIYGPLLDAWADASPMSDFGTHLHMLASIMRTVNPTEADHYGKAFEDWAAEYGSDVDPVHHFDAFVSLCASLDPTESASYLPAIRTWHRTWAAEAFADEVVDQVKQVLGVA